MLIETLKDWLVGVMYTCVSASVHTDIMGKSGFLFAFIHLPSVSMVWNEGHLTGRLSR